MVIPGTNDNGLADAIVKGLDAEKASIYKKKFPDNEHYVRIIKPSSLDNSIAIIVNTLYPDQNDLWIETLFLTNAARNLGADMVINVIPYMAYSRQDKVFLSGEPISINVFLKALRAAGSDCLITIDMHNPESLKEFHGCSKNVLVSDILAKRALNYVSKPIILAPDKGALQRAKYAAESIGAEFDYLIKTRDKVTGKVSLEPKPLSVVGKDVIIIDDIISTGGTIALAAKKCLENGAKQVIVAASHLLLVGDAVEKLKKANVKKVIGANTIPVSIKDPVIEIVDISRRVIEVLKELIA